MAAAEENFKSFLNKRKLEYSLRFPFLKENLIVAKLKRIWLNYRSGCSRTSQGSKLYFLIYALVSNILTNFLV